MGTYTLPSSHNLTNVFHVPDFHFNLISIPRLTQNLHCFVSFYPQFCLLQDLYSGHVKGIGREQHGLYLLLPHFSTTPTSSISSFFFLQLIHPSFGMRVLVIFLVVVVFIYAMFVR